MDFDTGKACHYEMNTVNNIILCSYLDIISLYWMVVVKLCIPCNYRRGSFVVQHLHSTVHVFKGLLNSCVWDFRFALLIKRQKKTI